MDYYKILNLSEDATLKEIEQAYKDLSSFYNPSNNVSKLAYKKYREIEKAYKILKENKQRELYNLALKNEVKINDVVSEISNSVKIEDFNKNIKIEDKEDIDKYKDILVDDKYNNYLHLKIELPYLYYLTNSEYEITYKKEIIKETFDICPVCLGIGKVKENNKVVYCRECLGTGKKVKKEEKQVSKYIKVNENVIDNDDKLVVEFDFFDKDAYLVNQNEIVIKHNVSRDEFYNGIKYQLRNNDVILNIEKFDFNNKEDIYIFLDKIIKFNWILDRYKGKDKIGYIVSDKEIVYLNPKDYTFSYDSDDVHTQKIELNDKTVIANNLGEKGYEDNNGDLILNVIKLKNDDDLKILFNKKIKKVSFKLFKLNGSYNNHYFKNKNLFDYDENYIYLPSLAYKLKMKHFTLFKVLFPLLYLILPIIMFIIFGLSYIFFITCFILLGLYLIGVNLLMEVKI